MLDFRFLDLIAELIVACEPPPKGGPGHPRSDLVRVVATLRRFLREGLPWRRLRATIEQVSGSALGRFLAFWAENAVLAKVHALLVAMLRGNPTLILDSCSVRSKRGGDLVGPSPTDRAKMGSKYHVAINGDGVPMACRATAANVPDTPLFERLFLAALGVMARIRNAYADKSYDVPSGTVSSVVPARSDRSSTSADARTAPAWADTAGRSSARSVGCWRTSASACATTTATSSFNPCCRPDAYSRLQPGWLENCENRVLGTTYCLRTSK